MNRLIHLICIIALLILFTTCKKNEQPQPVVSMNQELVFRDPPPLDTCPYFPPSPLFDGYNYTVQHPFMDRSFYNPKNGAQFVHLRDNQIYIYDTVSKIDRVLFVNPNGAVGASDIEWSATDWIFFDSYLYNPTGQIWKIKSNGDSLTQVTKDGMLNLAFTINHEGTKLVVGRQDLSNSKYWLVIMDVDGHILDTIKNSIIGGNTMDWSPDDTKLVFNGGVFKSDFLNISSYDLNNNQIIHLFSDSTLPNDGCDGLCWLPDSKNIITISQKGIFRINNNTGKITKLKNACGARVYIHASISPDGKNFICTRTDSRVIDYAANAAFESSEIYRIDVDGWNEHEIVIK